MTIVDEMKDYVATKMKAQPEISCIVALFGSAIFDIKKANDIDFLIIAESNNAIQLVSKTIKLKTHYSNIYKKPIDLLGMTFYTFLSKLMIGDVQIVQVLKEAVEIYSNNTFTATQKLVESGQILASKKQVSSLLEYCFCLADELKKGINKPIVQYLSIRTIYRSFFFALFLAKDIIPPTIRNFPKYKKYLAEWIGWAKVNNYFEFEKKMSNISKRRSVDDESNEVEILDFWKNEIYELLELKERCFE